MNSHPHEPRVLSYLTLFASLGTLVCCALPVLLVVVGLGTALASALSAAPWLVWLSRQKAWVFLASGVLLSANFAYVFRIAPRLRAAGTGCVADDPGACERAARFSQAVLWASAGIYAIAFFVAFALGPILLRFGE